MTGAGARRPPSLSHVPRHLFVLRHGPTDMNAAGVIQGRLDASLTPEGHAMVEAHARFLQTAVPPPPRLLCGPLKRTRETAAIISDVLGAPVEVIDALTEIGRGDLEGLAKESLPPRLDAAYRRFLDDPWGSRPPGPGAETFEDVEQRLRAKVVPAVERAQQDGRVAPIVVTHGSVGKILVAIVTGGGRDLVGRLPGKHALIWHVVDGSLEAFDGKRGYASVDPGSLAAGGLDA